MKHIMKHNVINISNREFLKKTTFAIACVSIKLSDKHVRLYKIKKRIAVY